MNACLKVMIIFSLFKKIHLEGCSTNNGKLTCENVILTKSNPLAVPDYKQVNSIDFDYCSIPVVPTGVFHNFDNTTVLWLDNSEVRTIEPGVFNGMASLQVLHLENNAIMDFKPGVFNGLNNLQAINLDENHLLKLNRHYFSALPRLTSLRFKHNNIKSISENAFEDLPNLKTLRLSYNAITQLEKKSFKNLEKLNSLDLAHNFLISIDCELLDNLRSLSVLHLDHNNLTIISKNCFRSLTSLKELYLNDNSLQEIEAKNIFPCLPQLSHTSLNNNAWTCNSLLDTVKVLKMQNINVTVAGTTNTTNVYGIVCNWSYKELDKFIDIADTVICNEFSDLSYHTTTDMTTDQSLFTNEVLETSEHSEIYFVTTSDFTVEPNEKFPISGDAKENCVTFFTTSTFLLIMGSLILAMNLIVCGLWCLICRRREHSYKIKNSMAMMAM